MKTAVVILNWNGWQDTIECLKSLNENSNDDIFILDNGSTNNSIKEIESFLLSLNFDIFNFLVNGYESTSFEKEDRKIYLCKNKENFGYAKGCNAAVDIVNEMGYTHAILLNNDTEVMLNSFEILKKSFVDLKCKIIIPQIRYFYEPEKIWNCGGEVNKLGIVKYYYKDKSYKLVPSESFKIGFATGCCMLFEIKFFQSIGKFTEKFFFGEEDVELSFRLNELGYSVFCEPKSIIAHKVSSSLKGDKNLLMRKSFLHYLNRFLNLKHSLNKIVFCLWKYCVFLKIFLKLMFVQKYNISFSIKYLNLLNKEIASNDGVSYKKFLQIIKGELI